MTQKEFNNLVKNTSLNDNELLEVVQRLSSKELVKKLKENQLNDVAGDGDYTITKQK